MEFIYCLRDMMCFTIPELLFVTAITYVLLKRYDLIDVYKPLVSFKNLFIPAIIASIFLTLTVYFGLELMGRIISMLSLYFIICLNIRNNTYQSIVRQSIKVFICMFIGLFIAMLIESGCMMFLIVLLKIDMNALLNGNNNFIVKFVTAFSWIIIEFCLLILLYMKKNNKFTTVLHVVLKNKSLSRISMTLVSLNSIAIFELIKLVLVNNIFYKTHVVEQIGITLGIVFVLPILVILFINVVVALLISKENQLQQLYQETDSYN